MGTAAAELLLRGIMEKLDEVTLDDLDPLAPYAWVWDDDGRQQEFEEIKNRCSRGRRMLLLAARKVPRNGER